VLACAPSTAEGAGATAALAITGIALSCCGFTRMADCATGCALAKLCCGTAVTAPFTFRFTYLTLLIVVLLLVLLLTMVVL
jgi:hypothetical protein